MTLTYPRYLASYVFAKDDLDHNDPVLVDRQVRIVVALLGGIPILSGMVQGIVGGITL